MSKRKSAHAPLVLVEWVDAASVTARWMDRREAIKGGIRYAGEPILACGFLIGERKNVIILALTYNHHNDDVGHVISIPRMAVHSLTYLRGVKGAKMPGLITKLS